MNIMTNPSDKDNSSRFSSSPTSVYEYIFGSTATNKRNYNQAISGSLSSRTSSDKEGAVVIRLAEFLDEIPDMIAMSKKQAIDRTTTSSSNNLDHPHQDIIRKERDGVFENGNDADPLMELMRHVQLDQCDLDRYAHFDCNRPYTRNLIFTDHTSYTLLLLCWNPGQYSPIHDHPCDGCYMKVLQGQVHECRYEKSTTKTEQAHHNDSSYPTCCTDDKGEGNESSHCHDLLVCTKETIGSINDILYIDDCIGYHKVGNPSKTEPAITLHLYCPPFEECTVWFDESIDKENETTDVNDHHPNVVQQYPTKTSIHHFSEYGAKIL